MPMYTAFLYTLDAAGTASVEAEVSFVAFGAVPVGFGGVAGLLELTPGTYPGR